MGIFDNYLGDIKREMKRLADGVETMQNNSQKIVGAIDNLEEKVNKITDEEKVIEELKQKINIITQEANDKSAKTLQEPDRPS